jgi:hypothetical protein
LPDTDPACAPGRFELPDKQTANLPVASCLLTK